MDFGDFTISTPTATGVVPVSSASEGLRAAGFQSTLPGDATIAFDTPINAFAVDLVDWASNAGNISSGGVHTLSVRTNTGSVDQILATAPPVRPDQNVIFFGVIDDSLFTSVQILSTTGHGHYRNRRSRLRNRECRPGAEFSPSIAWLRSSSFDSSKITRVVIHSSTRNLTFLGGTRLASDLRSLGAWRAS